VIGLDAGDADTDTFWTAFVRASLVQLAISDADQGLRLRAFARPG
jgi:hypothetical protein